MATVSAAARSADVVEAPAVPGGPPPGWLVLDGPVGAWAARQGAGLSPAAEHAAMLQRVLSSPSQRNASQWNESYMQAAAERAGAPHALVARIQAARGGRLRS